MAKLLKKKETEAKNFKISKFQNFSRLHALCGKKLVKMGSKTGKIAKKRTEAEVDFSKFSRLHALCGYFPFQFLNFTFFGQFFKKISKKRPISLEFPPEVVLFPLNQLIFQIFEGFTRSVAKSWWKWGPKMAKLLKKRKRKLIFETCFLKNARKKFEIYKIFHPKTGNTRLLLRF